MTSLWFRSMFHLLPAQTTMHLFQHLSIWLWGNTIAHQTSQKPRNDIVYDRGISFIGNVHGFDSDWALSFYFSNFLPHIYVCLCIYSLHGWWHFLLSGYQGEATSAQLIGQAIAKNPAFITLRKIEAAREIAQTISKSSNKVYLNADDLLLNLQEMKLDNSQWEQPVM